MEKFEEVAYARAQAVLVTPFSFFTFDDELKQTCAKDNVKVNINNQKAGKQGIKSDVICDAFLQTV